MIRLLVAVIATATAGTLPVFLMGAIAVQIRAELGFTATEHGFVFGSFFAAAAASSALLGRLAERLGPVRSLRVATVVGAALQLSIAAWARTWVTLAIQLALCGVVTALIQPAANLLLARAIPRRRQGLAFGIKQSAIPVATLLGGIAVPTLALTVGWRWAFVAGAALGIGAALTVPSSFERTDSASEVPDDGGASSRLALFTLTVAIACGAAAAGSVGSFLVSTGVAAGLSESAAGLVLTAGSGLGIVARLTFGALADSRLRDPLRVVMVLLSCGCVAFALLALGVRWVHLLATAIAFGGGWAWPGLFNLAVVLAYPKSPGTATGITQTGTYFGAVSGPLLFGTLVEHHSYAVAWNSMAGFALLAAIAVGAARWMLRPAARAPLPPT